MASRILRVLILCLALCALGSQAFGEETPAPPSGPETGGVTQPPDRPAETIKLEYKFAEGELLRYKMVMNMDIVMQASFPGAGSVPPMSKAMVGVFRQRTVRVLPNGDAEIRAAIESLKTDMAGGSETIPVEKMPVFKYVMSKTGAVKEFEGMQEMMSAFGSTAFGGTPFGGAMVGIVQYDVLPPRELKVGDAWSQDVPFPGGSTPLHIEGKLLRTDAQVANYTTAVIQQSYTGNLDMTVPGMAPSGAPGSSGDSARTVGSLTGNGSTYFSLEHGRMIKSEGTANLRMTMDFGDMVPEGEAAGAGRMQVSMQMRFEMFLLPAEKEK